MSLRDKIETDYKTALKSKDKNKISTYRLILSGIKDLDINNRSGPDKKETDDGDIKKLLSDKYFKRILIITGKNSYFKSGANIFFERLIANKQKKIFFKNSTLPEINELRLIINSIKSFQPQLLIAIGGGAVMDYAKIANLKNELSKF